MLAYPKILSAVVSETNTLTNSATAWSDLITVKFHSGELIVALGPLFLLFLGVATCTYLGWRFYFGGRVLPKYSVVKAKVKLGGIGEVEIEPNHHNINIAYQAWVELTTRKIALPFEPDHDVITEVYTSIYEAFGKLRELAKSIPAQQLRDCPDTRVLVETLVKVLNLGLRPHLTVWQSKFRRWYKSALEDPTNTALTPQEIQRKYPDYNALVADLQKLHDGVVEYSEFLRKVAQGDNTRATP